MSAPAIGPAYLGQFGPGLYPDVRDEDYHGDPALSSSGARTIVLRSPADYMHEREHGRPPKRELDHGHAAHRLILGKGAELEILPFADWRTDAAKDARDAARDAGKVPLLPKDYALTREMAAVALNHPLAGPLLAHGQAELSGWHADRETGAMLRIRMDWLTEIRGRLVIVDYKTAKAAGRQAFSKSAAEFGYYMQNPFYVDVARRLLGETPDFVFITQCKTPPYRVTVVRLRRDDVALGRALNRRAITRYAECLESGQWPDDDTRRIHTVALPTWARYQAEEYLS